jgi:hypothetical protein
VVLATAVRDQQVTLLLSRCQELGSVRASAGPGTLAQQCVIELQDCLQDFLESLKLPVTVRWVPTPAIRVLSGPRAGNLRRIHADSFKYHVAHHVQRMNGLPDEGIEPVAGTYGYLIRSNNVGTHVRYTGCLEKKAAMRMEEAAAIANLPCARCKVRHYAVHRHTGMEGTILLNVAWIAARFDSEASPGQ